MKDHLREIIQVSMASSPEDMLKTSLDACISLANADGGSILGEEGPHLQFLYSNVTELIGKSVPFDSLAGNTVSQSLVIYTYAPSDKRHFANIDEEIEHKTKYLLSIPIPSIHKDNDSDHHVENAGALQLLFENDIFPDANAQSGPKEFNVDEFEKNDFCKKHMEDLFCILPIIAFGMEIMKLRQTSYQAIHELKNKMISAHSWINYLKEDISQQAEELLKDPNILEDFELAESSVTSGAELAKSYLQFTKIFSPNFTSVNINDVLKRAASSAQAFATEQEAAQLKVNIEIDNNMTPREMDAEQLTMAFFNLCKNAIEALIEHNVEAPALFLSSSIDNDRLQIIIRDNGKGMPPEIADNLFIAFKTKKEGGTGLGLTITKKIIDVHGGSIRCKTDKTGTEFIIVL